MSNRIVIVSNRLPVSARLDEEGVRLEPAGGGVAQGLRPWHEGSGGLWVGWPGDVSRFAADERAELNRQLADRSIVPVQLSREHVDRSYHGFSNRVLWPLFHYLIDRVPVDAAGWDAYREVNNAFADVVAYEHRAGDVIWVHDYQLMLLPSLLRQRVRGARIGFFLHTPFPSSEVFRTLPWRKQILDGLLGADLVGFHTFAYMRHFVASLLHVDGLEADVDRVRVGDRQVALGVFPMGVDAAQLTTLAEEPDVLAEVEAIRRDAGGRQIVLGIDRLDYTKGIPRRLHAIERLLVRDPHLRDRVRYLQVAVPSRGQVDSYQKFKREVEEGVGRINGTCGTLRSAPVHYINHAVSSRELSALYRAADVMLVTPLRDGMNMVAKEFVASRPDGDGVLVLSEFAGAAAELDGALVVNPYDVDGVADAVARALSLPAGERRARMKRLRRQVLEHDVHAWAAGFISRLEGLDTSAVPVRSSSQPNLGTVVATARRKAARHLVLDYDGTLVPLARSPELAQPDEELLTLLGSLAAMPGTKVEIVSGRPRETLDSWFGHLPIALWAEHGFWHRPSKELPWQAAAVLTPDWMGRVKAILDQFAASTPGAQVEVKSASLAWHYRAADREFGARQAHELRMLLGDALSNQPLEVLEGKKVIEVHLRGVSKALVAHRLQAEVAPDAVVFAVGDDRTDEKLFRALPPSSITVAVGRQTSCARFHVDDHRAVRRLLQEFLTVDDRPPVPFAESSTSPSPLQR